MKQKVLIIKLGFIETIGLEKGLENISLGDILRSTAILHLFKDDYVTWLVTKEGEPLLADNPYVHRLLIYDLTSVLQLQHEHFDIVVNLEKVPGVCALADSIVAWRRYGFRFDVQKGEAEAYERADEALANSASAQLRKASQKHWLEILYEMLGAKWQGQSYILGYRSKSKEIYQVGLNFQVGKKWPNKSWPLEQWKELEKLLNGRYAYSWQQSLTDIHGYIDWINSCQVMVTNDSLGLHLAIALKKKFVTLFGPTSEKEFYFWDFGKPLTPPVNWECIPCFSPICQKEELCIGKITPETVLESIDSLLNKKV